MYTKNQRWYIFICSRTTPTTTAQNKRLLTIESHNHRIVRKYYLYLVFFVYFFSAAHFFSLSIHPPIHCTIIILLHMEFYILWIICFLLFVSSSPFSCFVTLFFLVNCAHTTHFVSALELCQYWSWMLYNRIICFKRSEKKNQKYKAI